MAAGHADGLADDLQALGGGLVAAVEDEAVRSHERRRAEVIVAGPEGRAGGGAAGAQDALGGVVEALALLGALQALLAVGGQRAVVDEVGQDLLVVVEEGFHIHDQVLDHLQAQDRLDGDLVAQVAHQGLAGQAVPPVDAHRIRAADAVRAGAAEGKRAVLIALDLSRAGRGRGRSRSASSL